MLSGSSPLTRGTLTCKLTEGQYIAVHPRLRGELTRLFSASSEAVGSSPLTRGTHTIQGPLTVTGRFIPAYAGNSALACSRRARRSVHPRLRGELILVLRPALIHIGSSPLTRGTPPGYFRVYHRPAVHPRLRGELKVGNFTKSENRGSSPLTRGTRRARLLPAYAGNSHRWMKHQSPNPVHPRLRGEL